MLLHKSTPRSRGKARPTVVVRGEVEAGKPSPVHAPVRRQESGVEGDQSTRRVCRPWTRTRRRTKRVIRSDLSAYTRSRRGTAADRLRRHFTCHLKLSAWVVAVDSRGPRSRRKSSTVIHNFRLIGSRCCTRRRTGEGLLDTRSNGTVPGRRGFSTRKKVRPLLDRSGFQKEPSQPG